MWTEWRSRNFLMWRGREINICKCVYFYVHIHRRSRRDTQACLERVILSGRWGRGEEDWIVVNRAQWETAEHRCQYKQLSCNHCWSCFSPLGPGELRMLLRAYLGKVRKTPVLSRARLGSGEQKQSLPERSEKWSCTHCKPGRKGSQGGRASDAVLLRSSSVCKLSGWTALPSWAAAMNWTVLHNWWMEIGWSYRAPRHSPRLFTVTLQACFCSHQGEGGQWFEWNFWAGLNGLLE